MLSRVHAASALGSHTSVRQEVKIMFVQGALLSVAAGSYGGHVCYVEGDQAGEVSLLGLVCLDLTSWISQQLQLVRT